MNDVLLILMYIAIAALCVLSPYVFITLWKKDQKAIADVLAYNKWYREERLRLIKEHKIELLQLQRKRIELEMTWQLDFEDKKKQMQAEVDAKFAKKGGFHVGA